MALKNIFSSKDKKDKKDKDNESIKSNKSGRRESANPLARTLSNWSHHKDKAKLKHSSFSSKSASLSAHDIKCLSEPFPPAVPTVSVSHQLPPTRGNTVTQNYQLNTTNPFATSPITPSGSIKDVNNVVHVLRNSMSSGTSLSTFASAIDEEKHTQYNNTSLDSLDTSIPVAAKQQVDTNPFLQNTGKQSQLFSPSPIRIDNDSNKLELSEDQYHAIGHFNYDAPMTPPDSAKNEIDSQELLHAELLAIQRQLNAANPNNAVDIRNRLDGVNQLLTRALDNTSHLETRLKSVMAVSKQTIIAINEENKALKSLDETNKEDLEQIKQQHKEMTEKHQSQLMLYQGLKDQHDAVIQENQELLQKTQELSARLDRQIATRKNISLLLNNGKTAEQDEEDTDLQGKLKDIIALSASSQLLNKQLQDELQTMTMQHAQEIEALKQTFQAVEQHHLESRNKELTAKDQQLASKHQELVTIQTKLETEKKHALALKHQELLALKKEMDAAAKAAASAHQALEQEQKNKYETLLAQLEIESAALKKNNQAEIQGLQDKLEQEHQHKLQIVQVEHENAIQELKNKAEADTAALGQQHESNMQAVQAKYTNVVNDIRQKQETWQQKEAEFTSQIESLQKSNSKDQLELASCRTHMEESEQEKDRFKSQIDMLKSHTLDDVQKVVQDNITLNQQLDKVEKAKEGLEKQHASTEAALATLTDALESTKEENLVLQSKVDELVKFQASNNVLKERLDTINGTLAEAQQQNETQALECHQLRHQLADMSSEAAKSAENCPRQLNDNAVVASKNALIVTAENHQLENELKMMDSILQENSNLSELVECLQAKLNELSTEDHAATAGARDKKDSQQEELMLMHTRAQLGLIEYLEGEDDVLLAMSKFKKQLEMK